MDPQDKQHCTDLLNLISENAEHGKMRAEGLLMGDADTPYITKHQMNAQKPQMEDILRSVAALKQLLKIQP